MRGSRIRRGRGRGRRVLAVVALLALLPTVALAQTAELEREQAELQQEREQTREELEGVRESEEDARARLTAVEEELVVAEQRLGELAAELEDARAAHQTAQAAAEEAREELEDVRRRREHTQRELDAKHLQLEGRVVAAFKYGQVSFAEAFTGVADIADFLNSGTYVAHVLDNDRRLVVDVQALLAEVEAQRAEAQVLRAEAEHEARMAEDAAARVQAAVDEQAAVTERRREQRAERERILEELREDRDQLEGHLEGLEEESRRIEEQLAEIARQEAARRARAGGGTSVSAEGWVRPVPGGLTSGFGARWGRNHNGVDLGGSVGVPVVAARDGVVVQGTGACHPARSWGCGGGFGNHLAIAHGDGSATIYAHLSTLEVGIGQRVGAGAPIGRMGNSGNSYGPHLHFEVRVAGVPRDPCGYIGC